MTVETHAFKESFAAGEVQGFALCAKSQKDDSLPPSFLTQKFSDSHLCMFVFETVTAAEKEKSAFPSRIEVVIEKVSLPRVQAFAKEGYFGIPALVFLRDKNGDFASL